VCAGAVGSEGLLLLGWMQSRIKGLSVDISAEGEPEPDESAVSTAVARPAPLSLGNVSLFEFEAPPAKFTFRREKGILLAKVAGDDDGEAVHRVRLPADMPGRLLALELKLLSGQDELYAASAQAAARLLK